MPGYFARRIREARERAGLSQGQLAELAGLHRSAVTRLELGRHGVTELQLERIAEALGITMRELVTAAPADEADDDG